MHESIQARRGGWYFGWNIVAFASVLTLATIGLRLGVGPFFFPMAASLGLDRSELSTIIALAMGVYALSMPGAGWLVARLGVRVMIFMATGLMLAGTICAAMATSTWLFTLGFAVLLSVGLAFASPVTLTPIVSRWFVRRRGMALFFLSTGGMAGLAVVTPALTWAIARFGWQTSLVGYVVIVALLAIPGAVLLVRETPPPGADFGGQSDAACGAMSGSGRAAEAGPDMRLRDALGGKVFWKVTVGLLANGFSMTLLGTHAIPMLIDHGFDALTGAWGVGLIGFVAIGSTVILGRMADVIPRRRMLAAIYLVRGLAFVGLMLAATTWQLYGVAIVGGLVWAGAMALASAIMADVYGVRILGVLYGIAYLCQQLAGMVSAWLGGFGYEMFGTHWLAFGAAAALLLVASWVTITLPNLEERLAQHANRAAAR